VDCRDWGLAGALLSGVYLLIVEHLWRIPLTRQLPGFHSSYRRLGDLFRRIKVPRSSTLSIMSRENLVPFSVADELKKWSKLRDEGVITEEQFLEARRRMLNIK